jgi:hypothetical protein
MCYIGALKNPQGLIVVFESLNPIKRISWETSRKGGTSVVIGWQLVEVV